MENNDKSYVFNWQIRKIRGKIHIQAFNWSKVFRQRGLSRQIASASNWMTRNDFICENVCVIIYTQRWRDILIIVLGRQFKFMSPVRTNSFVIHACAVESATYLSNMPICASADIHKNYKIQLTRTFSLTKKEHITQSMPSPKLIGIYLHMNVNLHSDCCLNLN